jgi:hypothetical protein
MHAAAAARRRRIVPWTHAVLPAPLRAWCPAPARLRLRGDEVEPQAAPARPAGNATGAAAGCKQPGKGEGVRSRDGSVLVRI